MATNIPDDESIKETKQTIAENSVSLVNTVDCNVALDHNSQIGHSKDMNFKVDDFKGILNNANTTHFSIKDSQHLKVTHTKTKFESHFHGSPNYRENVDEINQSLANSYLLEPEPLITRDDLGFCLKSSQTGRDTHYNHMLFPDTGCDRAPNRFLITGESGTGKTTLCKKLAYDWAQGKVDNPAVLFNLLVFKEFKTSKGDEDLETSLKRLCQEGISRETETSLVERALEHKDTSILLVLDGYDDASDVQKDQIRLLVENAPRSNSVFKKASILLTIKERDFSKDPFLRVFKRHYRLLRGRIVSTCPPPQTQTSPISLRGFQWNSVERPASAQLANMLHRNRESTQSEVRDIFSKFDRQ